MIDDKPIAELIAELRELSGADVEVLPDPIDQKALQSFSFVQKRLGKKNRIAIVFAEGLSDAMAQVAVRKEILSLKMFMGKAAEPPPNVEALIRDITKSFGKEAEVSLSTVVVPERKLSEGTLIRATGVAWEAIVAELKDDWSKAFQIPPRVWEEIIAGAYVKAGYDEVVLTPRSNDHGRDVIAILKGQHTIKVIDSVKAIGPGRLVPYDSVRAIIGVMTGERNASKGYVTTTSDFPPNILNDPYVEPFIPFRLELINGPKLQSRLTELLKKKNS